MEKTWLLHHLFYQHIESNTLSANIFYLTILIQKIILELR